MQSEVEIWKDIPEYIGRYQASNLGRIKSLVGWDGHQYVQRERILRPTIQCERGGYKRYIVRVAGRNWFVHRLVALAFLPNPNNYECINHIDCNALNNRVENLEWCTQLYNVRYAIKHHRNKRFSYVSKEAVLKLYMQGYDYKNIASKLNISPAIVNNVVHASGINRKQYPRILKYNISNQQFKDMFNQGMTNDQIVKKYNIPQNYVAKKRYLMKKGEI